MKFKWLQLKEQYNEFTGRDQSSINCMPSNGPSSETASEDE